MSANVPEQQTIIQEKEIDLTGLIGILFYRIKFIFSVTVIFIILSLCLAFFSTPVYMADILLQVEQKNGNSLLNSLSQMLPETPPDTMSEIQLLNSRMILGKTVTDLNLQNIIVRDFFPLLGQGWARLTNQPPEKLSIDQLTIPDKNSSQQRVILTAGTAPYFWITTPDFTTEGRVGVSLNKNGFTIHVKELEAAPGVHFQLYQMTKQQAISTLQKNFSVVEKGKNSGMLNLTLQGENPVLIVQILNSIASNYLQQNIERQATQDTKRLDYLQQQLPKVRQELDYAEDKLNAYRKQQDSVDLSLEAKSILEQIVNTDNQLNELTFREAEISQLYKKDHPAYKALTEKRPILLHEKARLSKQISAMPSTQQEVLRLSREVESGRAIYLQLLNRQQELNIARSSVTGNVRIIDPAVSIQEPVRPRKALIIISGALFGLFVSSGIVLLQKMLHQGIDSPEQLEERGIYVYATIPLSVWMIKRLGVQSSNILATRLRNFRHKKANIPYLPLDHPMDLSNEAIRGLRTSLHFAMMESSNNILMLTGATPDCGKTFISTTLAAMVSQTSKKVLFIDADMRLSYISMLFSLDDSRGLSAALSGAIPFEKAIQTYIPVGFDVITCGLFPPNPSELLMNERFRCLLSWASENYDMVIVDTPPILAVTDATIIGRMAGTTLLVVRAGINNIKDVTTAIQRLKQDGVNFRGAILNGITKRSIYGYTGYYQGEKE